MFSTLSLAMNMRAGSQDDVLAVQANQLGDPEPRLHGQQKHCTVTAPDPSGRVGGRQ